MPSAGFARNPGKSVKEFLTTDFADFTDKHTAPHPYYPQHPWFKNCDWKDDCIRFTQQKTSSSCANSDR